MFLPHEITSTISPVVTDLLSRYLCKQFFGKQGGSAHAAFSPRGARPKMRRAGLREGSSMSVMLCSAFFHSEVKVRTSTSQTCCEGWAGG